MTLHMTTGDLADFTREAVVAAFDLVIRAACDVPSEMTANEFGSVLAKARPDLEAQLVHALDQKAAEFDRELV